MKLQWYFISSPNAAWESIYPTPPHCERPTIFKSQQLSKSGLASVPMMGSRRLQIHKCSDNVTCSSNVTGSDNVTCSCPAQARRHTARLMLCRAKEKRHPRTFPAVPQAWLHTEKNQEPLFLTQHFPFQRKVLTPSSAGDLFLMDNRPSVYLHGSSATLKLESTILIKFYSSCQKQYGVREKLLCRSNKKVGVWVTWRCQKVIQF